MVLALALAGLAAVLVLALRGGGDDGSPAAGGATTAAERELLAVIPLAIRSDCEPVDRGPVSARASVSCGAPRTSEVNVWKGTGQAAGESMLRQWRCCMQLEPGQSVG